MTTYTRTQKNALIAAFSFFGFGLGQWTQSPVLSELIAYWPFWALALISAVIVFAARKPKTN